MYIYTYICLQDRKNNTVFVVFRFTSSFTFSGNVKTKMNF